MQRVLPPFSHTPALLVIGDLMIDHTILGKATKLANEGPIPVLHQSIESWTLGGCGNVAVNCRALGATVHLFAAVGPDAPGKLARDLLEKHQINWIGEILPEYQTTTKHRGFADSKLMFRYDQEIHLTHFLTQALTTFIESTPLDAILFSDYNKGICSDELIQKVMALAKKLSIHTIVDPKGDFRRYSGCTVLKPNRDEASRFIHTYVNQTVNLNSLDTIHTLLLQSVAPLHNCITMAKEGLSISSSNKDIVFAKTQSIEVIDVTGAGDIVNAVLGVCFACRAPLSLTATCAAFLATQSVQHKGTYILQDEDFAALTNHLRQSKRINVDELATVRQEGKKVIFTNGCFDLLHAGHIQSLRFAKAQGDILVVGVNSDASIRRLKGPSRPILLQEERLAALEALECVDYICVFEDDSPLNLVRVLRPDILVKGEDYKGKEMRSAEFAGEVVFAPLRPSLSTTEIIRRISTTTPV
jgi:D-beta-D-heptose 7-phosphate kinase / D-beta-D-heptose 1-phosphate adenosyltransferase